MHTVLVLTWDLYNAGPTFSSHWAGALKACHFIIAAIYMQGASYDIIKSRGHTID